MQSLTTLGSSITKDDVPYVEELLRKIFSALPSDKGMNPLDLIDSYMIALRGLDKNGLRQTVFKIISGTLDAKLRFVPRPPELANYVRAETRLIHQLGQPAPSGPVQTTPMFDAMRKRWAGVPVLHSGISLERANTMAKKREVPVGAVYVAILECFYMPPPGFYGDKKTRPLHGKPVVPVADPDLGDKDPAYWQQISSIKQEPAHVTVEQEQFRAKVEATIEAYQAENEASVGQQRESE